MSELHALSFGIVKSGCDLSDFDALLVLLLPLLLLAERARAASGDNNFKRRIYSASLVQKASRFYYFAAAGLPLESAHASVGEIWKDCVCKEEQSKARVAHGPF